MRRTLVRLLADEAANIATLFALVSPLLVGAAAFAVDEATLYLERRQLQHTADMAAIHAVGDPGAARARVLSVLADAGYDLPDDAVTVTPGRYTASPDLPPAERFVAGVSPANAVSVALADRGRLHFASIFGMAPPPISVAATASATPRAAYSIGSRLASLNGGVLNAVLGGLLGTELSLSLVDYNAIAGVDVDLLSFLDALAGEIDLTAGSYSDLLDADVALADIAAALSVASDGNAVFAELAGLIDEAIMVEMLKVVGADGIAHLALGTAAAVEAQISALHLLSAAALVADGNRQITLALGADVPGLVEIGVALVVGEPPQGGWFTLAGQGSYVRTAQVRLRLDIALLSSAGTLGVLNVSLPVYAELAPAQAQLTAIACPPGRPQAATATLAVTPGILRLAVGTTPQSAFLDTTRPLQIARTPIVSILSGLAEISARADISMAQTAPIPIGFTHSDVVNRTVKTVSTTTPLTALSSSLLGNLELELDILRLNLLRPLLSGATRAVANLITPVAPTLDATLTTLFDVLGLGLGEADLRVHGFDCRNGALVG